MKIKSSHLIDDLVNRIKQNKDQVQQLSELNLEQLNWKQVPNQWSILECIEHLNYYGDFYIPEIEKRIKNSNATAVADYKPGILGNYFANSMLPKEKLNKMNTFKSMNPIGSNLDKSVFKRFIDQQNKMLELLEQARKVNLNKIKTSISITNMIKLKLGDTFRVVIYHNDRHLVQAQKVKVKQLA